MKWTKDDVEKYASAKEYVDTAVIPVQSFQLSQDEHLVKEAFAGEVLTIYANEIEKELSGRLLLTPTYTYNKQAGIESEISRLNDGGKDIKAQRLEHVCLVKWDHEGKKPKRT